MVLTSLKNPWLKQFRRLHQAKYRRSQGQFLIEGTHLIQEAIAAGYPLLGACATPDWQQSHPELWQAVAGLADRQELVTPEAMGAMATTVTPDGVVAIAARPPAAPLSKTVPNLGIAVETLQDPGNLGTLIRTAAAVGSDGIWLSAGSIDPFHPKVLRASAGQWFRVPQQVTADWLATVTGWRAAGAQVLATAAEGDIAYWELDLRQPTVLMLGNEGNGLSEAALAAASDVVAIPMAAGVESLNVGVAAAVILFEAQRQRRTD